MMYKKLIADIIEKIHANELDVNELIKVQLVDNEEIAIALIKHPEFSSWHISKWLLDNETFMQAAVLKDFRAIAFLSERLRNDKAFIKAIQQKCLLSLAKDMANQMKILINELYILLFNNNNEENEQRTMAEATKH